MIFLLQLNLQCILKYRDNLFEFRLFQVFLYVLLPFKQLNPQLQILYIPNALPNLLLMDEVVMFQLFLLLIKLIVHYNTCYYSEIILSFILWLHQQLLDGNVLKKLLHFTNAYLYICFLLYPIYVT